MKLLIQSDDYGMTRAVAKGIIHGIENGIIRNTGMFMNMPWTDECAEWIKPYLSKIALGIDLNLTTGRPISNPKEVPSLVNEHGNFYTSWESRKMDIEENGFNHVNLDEVRNELDKHIQKYIRIFGKTPDYLHSHAYETKEILQIHHELAKKYDIIYCSDIMENLTGKGILDYRIGWYNKPPTLDNQANSSFKQYILNNSMELLKNDYVFLIGHMGYVDKELMNLSTYSLYRLNDLDAVVDREIIDWVRENKVELISYKDLSNNK